MILFDFLSAVTTAQSSFDEIPTDFAISHVFWASTMLVFVVFGGQLAWNRIFRSLPWGLGVVLHCRWVETERGGGSIQIFESPGEADTGKTVDSSMTMGSTHTRSTQDRGLLSDSVIRGSRKQSGFIVEMIRGSVEGGS